MKTVNKATRWVKMQMTKNPFKALTWMEKKKQVIEIHKVMKRAYKDAGIPKPTRRDAKKVLLDHMAEMWYANDKYQVAVDYSQWDSKKGDGIIWLSIKNHERTTGISWQHKQWIKNDICGEEMEAVEIFPAESRMVNTANQYHLWVMKKVPFGFPVGFVTKDDVDGKGKQTLETQE